jgi:2'-5' RNA ligase
MRIFTAVKFNNETKAFLYSLKKRIESVYSYARFTNKGNLHMTITFIGEADSSIVNKVIRATTETASKIKSFHIETGNISSFKRRNKHKVYCEVKKSQELEELYGLMCSKLTDEGIRIERKPYIPHITMARQAVKTGDFNETYMPEHKCLISEICVMESTRIDGILTYIPVAEAKLEG